MNHGMLFWEAQQKHLEVRVEMRGLEVGEAAQRNMGMKSEERNNNKKKIVT